MELSRRFFLGGAIALVAVQTFKPTLASSNMPKIYGDLNHDDSAGFNALFSNEPVIFNKEQIGVENHQGIFIYKGSFRIDSPIEINRKTNLNIVDRFTIDAYALPIDEPLFIYEGKFIDMSKYDGLFSLGLTEIRKVPLFRNKGSNDENFNLKIKPISYKIGEVEFT